MTGLTHHPIATYLRLLCDCRLLSINDGLLTVIGVAKKHSKFTWKPAPNGERVGNQKGRVGRDREGEGESPNGDQMETETETPPTPPRGDVRSDQRLKRTKKSNPEIKIFINWYSEEHLKIIKNKYVVQGVKDATAVKRLLGTLSLDELKARAMRFLEDLKSWPDNDKKIIHLENQINKYGERNEQTGAYKQDSKYPEPDVVAE